MLVALHAFAVQLNKTLSKIRLLLDYNIVNL